MINYESLLMRLNTIRTSLWSPHGAKMAAIGYVGALFEFDMIDYNQYCRANDLIDNAADYRNQELRK